MAPPTARPDYDMPSMERLLERCDQNIRIFQTAIEKEERAKAEYAEIIRVLKEKAALSALKIAVPGNGRS